ncbi:unnamed protein product, partial [Discosporangium mesarthrocarpum]
GEGRSYVALVADAAKAQAVSDQLAAACAAAVDRGWFSDLHQPPVTVGREQSLPDCVPVTISTNTVKELADREDDGADGGDDQEDQEDMSLTVAKATAETDGIEIKGSVLHGLAS